MLEIVREATVLRARRRGLPGRSKWCFIPKGPGQKYLAVNADESEPGTFKDREIMESEPHLLLEGSRSAATRSVRRRAFIYIRGEYIVRRRSARTGDRRGRSGRLPRATKILGTDFDLTILVFRGAGAYICGEETALLESLEGKRPMPRSRPPFPAVEGLYGRPTVINNVETLANVPAIIDNGADWYKTIGTPTEHRPEDLLASAAR